jgi:hypothetical protein
MAAGEMGELVAEKACQKPWNPRPETHLELDLRPAARSTQADPIPAEQAARPSTGMSDFREDLPPEQTRVTVALAAQWKTIGVRTRKSQRFLPAQIRAAIEGLTSKQPNWASVSRAGPAVLNVLSVYERLQLNQIAHWITPDSTKHSKQVKILRQSRCV